MNQKHHEPLALAAGDHEAAPKGPPSLVKLEAAVASLKAADCSVFAGHWATITAARTLGESSEAHQAIEEANAAICEALNKLRAARTLAIDLSKTKAAAVMNKQQAPEDASMATLGQTGTHERIEVTSPAVSPANSFASPAAPQSPSSDAGSDTSAASSNTFPEAPHVFRLADDALQGSWVSTFKKQRIEGGPLKERDVYVEKPTREPVPDHVKAIRFEPPSRDLLIRIAGPESYWIIVPDQRAGQDDADRDEDAAAREKQEKEWYREFLVELREGVDSEEESDTGKAHESAAAQGKEDEKSAMKLELDEEVDEDATMQAT